MELRHGWRLAGLLCVVGCGPLEPELAERRGGGLESSSAAVTQQGTVQLNILYVHGVKGCQDHRLNAENSLNELDAAMAAALPARISAYQSSHPGVTLVVRSAHANLYTAPASPYHPSDSTNPLNMDDWEVGDPGCSTTRQGDPCTTAYEWRYRLAREIERRFPAGAKNVLLVGHSTGARVAFEVAANMGPGGVGTQNWGVQDRIAGVVSIQGMVDSLGTSKYNVVGAASFVTTCKNGDPIVGFGDSCALGNGWCEYAGNVGGFPAADWVARNKAALMLTSWASCSPSLWTGYSDGPLPFDAQGSGQALGTGMTPAPGQTWRPAHGVKYGSFCHSAIVDPSLSGHAQAVAAARDRILDFVFSLSPSVASSGSLSTSTSIAYNTSTPTYSIGSACPAGKVDEGLQVVGVCKHPGYFDGDDHAIAASELTLTNGTGCTGAFKWTQKHDSGNKHAATFWWKTHALPAETSLLATLPAD
jgi:pimeloyl-ACP methyl ester carboxylesterase